jgi:hypothetical protein
MKMYEKRKNILSLFWMAVVFSAFVITFFAPATLYFALKNQFFRV